jgi:hypothetical protein
MSYAPYVSHASLASRYPLKGGAMDRQSMCILSCFIRRTLQVGNDVKTESRLGA